MSRFFFSFLFGLDEKLEKKGRERKREREKEKIYHIVTMMMKMMFFFSREIYDRECTRQRKSALMD